VKVQWETSRVGGMWYAKAYHAMPRLQTRVAVATQGPFKTKEVADAIAVQNNRNPVILTRQELSRGSR
jgi:hypothetical protein